MKFLKAILLILTSVLTLNTFSQDIHFSQFYYSPLSLNPANTGHFEGDWRISNNYRTQWGSISIPYNTISIGFDKTFYFHSQKIGGGIFFVNDNSGNAHLSVNKIFLSGAYHNEYKGHNLHAGIQIGFVVKSFGGDVTYPSQYDRGIGGFNNQLPNNETALNDNLSYPDINFGLMWSKRFGKIEPEAGYTVFHINNPKESFTDVKNRLPLRHVFHVGTKIDLNQKFFVKPRLLYMNHKRAGDMIIGANFGYNLPVNNYKMESLFFGPHFRTILNKADALIFALGINFKNMDIGISYDVNISPLQVASSGAGALEFSLIYRSKSSVPNKVAIPCDRF
jgi:type IX secretion system PorP/SprF family membrane protein